MRKQGLDILRAVAVILVIIRHAPTVILPLKCFGWLGVDLFFVLSGYLIASQIFKTYKIGQPFNISTFLIKRSFKIWPPFYFFLLSTTGYYYLRTGTTYWQPEQMFSELFLMQSYFPSIYIHTWSISVEEQFYIVFALFSAVAFSKKWYTHKNGVIVGCVLLVLSMLLMRVQYLQQAATSEKMVLVFQTHRRADGIVMGVLLAYLKSFTTIFQKLQRYRILVSGAALLLILPGFILGSDTFFMQTIGITLVDFGFMILVFLMLTSEKRLQNIRREPMRKLLNMFRFIGVHSYSIYLWHLYAIQQLDHVPAMAPWLHLLCCMTVSIVVGVVMSYIIEVPALRWRNRVLNHLQSTK